ncbi:MAG: hypothetical protein HXS54_10555 [Theionarchaea archaeon]|nr:hypothetical protein [Theionarchaea archaeon]
METLHTLGKNEKDLLNALGRFPDASMKELLGYTAYKQVTTVARKVNQFKEQITVNYARIPYISCIAFWKQPRIMKQSFRI